MLHPCTHALFRHPVLHYDADKRDLLIGFQSGKQYVYEDVPPEIANGLKAAGSRGEYFNDQIRDRYKFRRREP